MKTTTNKAYQVDSNLTVKELNANVLIKTFADNKCIQLADIYKSKNEPLCIVGFGSTAPVNSEYVKTIRVKF